jgi:Zn-dependent protease/predicted transcriptional regulator
MKSSLRLFRIAGIDIGVHYSWILIFILFATSFALGFFGPVLHLSVAAEWIAGVVAALLLFASVLLHELAHSLVAQARGLPVRSITLFIFGGVSNLEEEPQKPSTEFSMSIVGPLTSFILGIIFFVIYFALQPGATIGFPRSSYNSIAAAMMHYLGYLNVLLAIFNILPGFPLDGGRVLRSIIWGATNNLVRATNIAATIGRLLGWAFIALGIFLVFYSSNLLNGIWFALIGWFLSSAADSSRAEVIMREHLAGAKVKDAMLQAQETIPPQTTVSELVNGVFNQRYRRAVPVCQDNHTIGIVTISDVKGLPQDKWPVTPVEQIMTREPLYSMSPDDSLNAAMKLIAQHDLNQVLVMDKGQCTGLLTRAEIIRYLQLSQELKMKPKGQ